MPDFAYVARNNTGQKTTGTVSAPSQREAVALLASQSLFPMEVHTSSTVVEGKATRGGRVPAQLLVNVYGQLADLLKSGVPLLRALDVLHKQSSNANLKSILEQVHHQVEEGSTLADAMGRFQRVFGEMPISMIRAGGEGGFLEEVLTQVAQFTESQDDLKKRTMGALAYPAVLMVVGLTVVTVLVVYFVPKFAGLFERLRERGQLPWATEFLLGLSHTLQVYGIFILPALVALGFLLRLWLHTDDGRLWWDSLRMRLPLAGPIVLNLAVARFCRVLGTLLRNGVPILRSLDIASGAAANRVLAVAIGRATENISAGQPLAGPLGASGHFPALVVEMIAVAEQSNNLEKVLLDVADTLERRTWRRLEMAVKLLEPLMLVVMAGIVLLVVLALLLPVLKMSTAGFG